MSSDQDELLREAAATGNDVKLESLIQQGVNVNSQNSVNGWTALHWACRRNHRNIVERLLQLGADASIETLKGETCLQLTADPQIRRLLGAEGNGSSPQYIASSLSITPSYITNPIFPYCESPTTNCNNILKQTIAVATTDSSVGRQMLTSANCELVLKVRVADSDETDFIEVDVQRGITYKQLIELMLCELCVDANVTIRKLRKLPNTIVRNDRDVSRLCNYNELELVLNASQATKTSLAPYKATVSPKLIKVVY